MDDSNSEAARRSDDSAEAEMTPEERRAREAQDAAESLRDQIAVLRQQVRNAQDTLRDHHRRSRPKL
jgi:hypothetical protein